MKILLFILIFVLSGCSTSNFTETSTNDIKLALCSAESLEDTYYFVLKNNGTLTVQKGIRQDSDITQEPFIITSKTTKQIKLASDISTNICNLADEVYKENLDIQYETVEDKYNDAYYIEFKYKDILIKQIYNRPISPDEETNLKNLIGFVPEHMSAKLKCLVDEFVSLSPIEIEYPFG